MMRKLTSRIAVAVIVASLFASPAMAGRQDLDQARAQLMRLHIRLESEANNAPQVIEARKQAGVAYTDMYKRRAEVLTRLYQTDDYKDLRLALYHTQRKLAGIREEIPVRVQTIMTGASDALAVRIQITAIEAAALEADADFVEVRDVANALNAAYRQTLRDSRESIKSNPEFVALCDQVASMTQSVTGMRSVARLRG